ncbi:hypothetical protein EV13_2972 [Prochlorococcus sp. MIT 0702]|nr:hypothetical protein EV12_2917 [Prochlorococcus sp. MIT 0701]KGG26191.1 hypothetical protein EV13_2972 [Prochlorococcus sp. MIT 0702]KGG33012.1 hypothetical protein EV14_1853 [Prochlorococcus sp. MIT 0703]
MSIHQTMVFAVSCIHLKFVIEEAKGDYQESFQSPELF